MNTDYKHIEQLLNRYWQCETSLQEEEELRAFFQQEEVPLHLFRDKDFFVYQQMQQEITLGEDFDNRVLLEAGCMEEVGAPIVKARRLTVVGRLIPLFKAAAVVAVILTAGSVMQQSFFKGNTLDYNYDAYSDTYDDPEVAYKQVSSALIMMSEGINKSKDQHLADSLKAAGEVELIKE